MIIKGTAEIKAHLSEFISRVLFQQERILIARRGKPVAALISIDDLHRLEALENQKDSNSKGTSHPIMQAFGGWADMDDVAELEEEIYKNRRVSMGREVEI